jgi:hypothetical protein
MTTLADTTTTIAPGEIGTAEMPWSEVCMHLRVAGKVMRFEFLGTAVQLLDEDGKPFSFPITAGEAGIHQHPDGTYYYEGQT